MLYEHTLVGFPTPGFSLFLYVNKYHVSRDDVLPGVVLCDSHQGFASRVPNKLESVFGSNKRKANKNACSWIWSFFGQYLC